MTDPTLPRQKVTKRRRINTALEIARRYGSTDGDHHKAWVIDQMVRALLVHDEGYRQFVNAMEAGKDGPYTYKWHTGVAP